MVDRGEDSVTLLGDRSGELHERRQSAATRPRQPPVQQSLRGRRGETVDLAQLLLEQVGAVQASVRLLDRGELRGLAIGEVLRVARRRTTAPSGGPGPELPTPAGRTSGMAQNFIALRLVGLATPALTRRSASARRDARNPRVAPRPPLRPSTLSSATHARAIRSALVCGRSVASPP